VSTCAGQEAAAVIGGTGDRRPVGGCWRAAGQQEGSSQQSSVKPVCVRLRRRGHGPLCAASVFPTGVCGGWPPEGETREAVGRHSKPQRHGSRRARRVAASRELTGAGRGRWQRARAKTQSDAHAGPSRIHHANKRAEQAPRMRQGCPSGPRSRNETGPRREQGSRDAALV
jgi:hypothetical protein